MGRREGGRTWPEPPPGASPPGVEESDGCVYVWDAVHRKKVAALPRFDTSIAALCFSRDGARLAIAASYTFEEGDKEHPADAVYVRTMADAEVAPKTRQ